MKLLVLFVVFFVANLFCADVSYTVRWCGEEEKPVLEVLLIFEDTESTETTLLLPSNWAGQNDFHQEIIHLECRSPDAWLEDTNTAEKKIVYHVPGQKVEIVYRMQSREREGAEWYYRPVIDKKMFFLFGHNFFVIPTLKEEEKSAHIVIKWENFPPNWQIANSYGIGIQQQEMALSFEDLKHAIYVGGDFELIKTGSKESPLYIAILSPWSFPKERFQALCETIVEFQRAFWNDFTFPPYLITVVPTGNIEIMGGTALHNAFALFVGDIPENDRKLCQILQQILAHEHFHTWNGLKINFDAPEGSHYWFSEGFTDYYTHKLNYQAELIDAEEYAGIIEHTAEKYFASPVLNVKNEKIEQAFWGDWDLQQLPYLRGFMLALLWDKEISRRSCGAYSLDDVMRQLFAQTRQYGMHQCPPSILEQILTQFLEEARSDIQKYVIEGETVPFDAEILHKL